MKGNSFLVVFFALLLWDTMRQGEGMGDGDGWWRGIGKVVGGWLGGSDEVVWRVALP